MAQSSHLFVSRCWFFVLGAPWDRCSPLSPPCQRPGSCGTSEVQGFISPTNASCRWRQQWESQQPRQVLDNLELNLGDVVKPPGSLLRATAPSSPKACLWCGTRACSWGIAAPSAPLLHFQAVVSSKGTYLSTWRLQKFPLETLIGTTVCPIAASSCLFLKAKPEACVGARASAVAHALHSKWYTRLVQHVLPVGLQTNLAC